MIRHQQEVAKVLWEDPNIFTLSSSAGASQFGAGNTGRVFARLKDKPPRTATPEQVIEELRPKFAEIPGIRVYLQNPPLIRIGGQVTRSLYQYTLQGPDTTELYKAAFDFEAKVRDVPGLQDVSSDLLLSSPRVIVNIDRDRASSLGVTPNQIENALYDAYGARQVSTIYTSIDEYWVMMEVLPEYQRDPEGLSLLYIRSNNGTLVPLNAVAKLERGIAPLVVNHLGQLPSATISFNLKPGVPLGEAVERVHEVAT